MKLRLHWAGRTRLGFAKDGIDHYMKLLRPLRPVEIHEVKESKAADLARWDVKDDVRVALVLDGEAWTSERWAEHLGAWNGPWLHVDLEGPSRGAEGRGTGFGVALLLRLFGHI